MKYLIAVAITILFASAAVAQDNTVNVGELISPLLQAVIGAVGVLITAIVGWIATQIQKRTGIEIEAKHREALQAALTNGAGLALNKLSSTIASKNIDVRNPVIKEAIEYVIKAVPDAIAYFGISPADLAEKLAAKIGVVTAPTTEPTV